jgi:hypothetical protein
MILKNYLNFITKAQERSQKYSQKLFIKNSNTNTIIETNTGTDTDLADFLDVNILRRSPRLSEPAVRIGARPHQG